MKTHFKFHYVYCGQHLECEPGLSGRQIRCPTGKNRIIIPADVKGQPAWKQPLTKFTWDTLVEVPEVQTPKARLEQRRLEDHAC